ncbi:AMP-binding protein [Aromatoleum toluclasticum]|uniref:AMP-binding protein n=1 Tax=Aromatoleum toluclasticum TaxID=92003 RepID=UPI001D19731F|nr:AMP-binding protein [Aromatoleum toluclasticum]MCC4118666.1 AMP-binding protein [Aromatoleum toluclasticum]
MLKGLMQDVPLLVSSLIEHAARCHPDAEIVSRTAEGTIDRSTYRDIARRAQGVARALLALGVKPGERIGTLAWNGYRHLEMYYGVPGIGAVLHTIHPRQFPEQLEYVINHAEDQHLFFDVTFAPLVERLAPMLRTVKHFVAMTDRRNLPLSDIPNLLCYEDLIAGSAEDFSWPVLDETTASSLCYTAGTTETPKGVLYSHRSTVLHAFAICAADSMALSANETALLAAPMFHVNGWGVPYAAAMCGMKLVLPGPANDGQSLYELMRDERVTLALGGPNVWSPIFAHADATHRNPRKDLGLRRVVIGGGVPGGPLTERFASQFRATVTQVWGMTESSPIGAVSAPVSAAGRAAEGATTAPEGRQGRAPFGVELRLVDDAGRRVPHDGLTRGHLRLRGPWVPAGYFKATGALPLDADGFFASGDIATIDGKGGLQVTGRAADALKSGGEWMSSAELEAIAVGHPDVFEAALITLPGTPSRTRRLLIILRRSSCEVSREELLDYLAQRLDRRWLPDDMVFVEHIPHTATGKVHKGQLREMFAGHPWPSETAAPAV